MKADIDIIIRNMIKNGGFKTQKNFAKWAGCTEGYITKWKKQGYIPEEIISKYKSKYGELINQKETNEIVSINLYENISIYAIFDIDNVENMPKKLHLDKTFLEKIFNLSSFENLNIIKIARDFMLPDIQDGEYILIQREAQPKNGDTIIANFNNEIYIRRYKKISPFERWFKLESSNQDYPSIDIDTDEKLVFCKILGVVKGKIKIY